MHRNTLRPQQILPRLQHLGNLKRPTVIILNHVPGSPSSFANRAAQQTLLLDLEPLGAHRAVALATAGALRHPCDEWADVVSVCVPECGDFGTRCDRGGMGSGSSGRVARHVRGRGIFDGVECVPLALDGVLSSGVVVRHEASNISISTYNMSGRTNPLIHFPSMM